MFLFDASSIERSAGLYLTVSSILMSSVFAMFIHWYYIWILSLMLSYFPSICIRPDGTAISTAQFSITEQEIRGIVPKYDTKNFLHICVMWWVHSMIIN